MIAAEAVSRCGPFRHEDRRGTALQGVLDETRAVGLDPRQCREQKAGLHLAAVGRKACYRHGREVRRQLHPAAQQLTQSHGLDFAPRKAAFP